MAEIMGAEAKESRITTVALDDEGYVLALLNTGKVKKHTGVLSDGPAYGIGYKSTKNPVTLVAEAEKPVAIVKAPKKANVQAKTGGGETIAIGDLVSVKGCNAAGTVKKHAGTAWPTTWAATTAETISDEYGLIVGIALAAVAQNTTTKIEVQLLCPMVAIKQ